MFVCLQKDAKQCCDATKLDVLIVLVAELCVWHLFGDKHQNLMSLKTEVPYRQLWVVGCSLGDACIKSVPEMYSSMVICHLLGQCAC